MAAGNERLPMLFGLIARPELNGRAVHALRGGAQNEQGRIAVELIPLHPSEDTVTILVRPQNLGWRASVQQLEHIFSSKDVVSAIASVLCRHAELAAPEWAGVRRLPLHENPMHLGDLESAALACKTFAEVIHGSDEFWRRLCLARWRTKFGFRRRWQHAVASTPPLRWRVALQLEEERQMRSYIEPEELHLLTFDFRFWVGAVGTDGVLDTGLRRSISARVRLQALPPSEGRVANEELERMNVLNLQLVKQRLDYAPPLLAHSLTQGAVLGHPNGDAPRIRWFMLNGRVIQWGYFPELWPVGKVEPLASWGWQIANPNVCMRAVDEWPLDMNGVVTSAEAPSGMPGGAVGSACGYNVQGEASRAALEREANFDDLLATLRVVRRQDGLRMRLPQKYVDELLNHQWMT